MSKKKKRDRRPNLAHLENRPAPDARVRELRAALHPFADLPIVGSSGPDVWLYRGHRDVHGSDPHLKISDFIRAREALGLA